jgi:dihydroflavonol-4-reductase
MSGGNSGMNLVTGGTGFIGAHVVRVLLRRGGQVRCLVRPSSRRDNLEGLSVEIAVGDVTDPESLRRALAGVKTVYHCAADYRLYARDPRALYEANVTGTENVMRAAAQAGVEKVVHTSSVGALGRSSDGAPANEETPVAPESLAGHYKRSKHEAERAAQTWASRGLPVVIVNPSTPVGELDVKPTPTGQMIVDFLNRRMPAYVDTGLNVVDVRDVAEGHILAAERGRVGEKYILGNRNMTLKEILDALSRLTGIPSPKLRLPHWIPLTAAFVDTCAARVTGRIPRVPLEGVRMSRYRMFFDASKALRDLAIPQTPVEEALARAVAWFRENGYVRA